MDNKWFKVFYIYMLIIHGLGIISSTTSEVQLVTDDEKSKCVGKLQSCSLTLVEQLLSKPGPEGDRGDKGFPGILGPKGFKGDKGIEGPEGTAGLKGTRGDNGFIGEIGPQGLPGVKGRKGQKGENGKQGFHGEKGKMGKIGIQGPPGPQGENGDPGRQGEMGHTGKDGRLGKQGNPGLKGRPSTDCKFVNIQSYYKLDDDDKFGMESEPATVTCKYAPDNFKSGTYFIGPELQVMRVHCNMSTNETCISSGTFSKKYYYTGQAHDVNENNVTYKSKEGAFWLSDTIDLLKLYNLTSQQIVWLQKRSSSVSQKIRYHCNNSVPYFPSDISSSIQLLTWNDVVIGPYSSEATPFSYYVPAETHKCKKGSKSKQYSEIVLRSNYVYRLPIRDILISDVRDALQMFYIESSEICFA